jgi:pyruvate dehydrogenase E1 component alpha subunit
MEPRAVMAELYGKATGPLGGRGGHMHLADFRIGVFGSNGIVGAGVGIALGAAYAAKARQLDQIAVGFCGDGAANIGRLWEFVNLAAVWSLPLVVVCENNLYAVETDSRQLTGGGDVADRAAGFGLPVVQVDGQDVAAVHRVMTDARERAVAGGGPTFVEALTYRYSGHSAGEAELYREPDEVERWRATRDPIMRAGRALVAAGALPEDGLERLHDQARALVQEAIAFAEESPWPDPATATLAAMSIDRWTEEVSR